MDEDSLYDFIEETLQDLVVPGIDDWDRDIDEKLELLVESSIKFLHSIRAELRELRMEKQQ